MAVPNANNTLHTVQPFVILSPLNGTIIYLISTNLLACHREFMNAMHCTVYTLPPIHAVP